MLQGCRSVEEFHCLNRIEEGTYGVVYRARDRTTEEIVALKRLKMEKEKEGFPITSLREINTLLKVGSHAFTYSSSVKAYEPSHARSQFGDVRPVAVRWLSVDYLLLMPCILFQQAQTSYLQEGCARGVTRLQGLTTSIPGRA